jgi:cell division protein FtsW (lipid II flippase)
MSKKAISIFNLLSIIILIAWNGYANTGNYNGKTVGELSAEYGNLFTPASYAFSIWGLIFLMLMVFGIYGVYNAFTPEKQKNTDDNRTNFLQATSPWFVAANVFCTLWVVLWLDEHVAASVIFMCGILFCLLMCVRQLDMEIWDAPFPIIAFVWWPLCLYTGWISVAIIANVSAWLNGTYEISQETQEVATAIMIFVAFIVNALMVYQRNMREYAMVGVWALAAIAVRHYGTDLNYLAMEAIALAIILFIGIAYHGSQNLKTNPMLKLKQWRASK